MKLPRFSLGGLRPWLFASVILPFTVLLLGLAIVAIEIHGRAMRSLVAERDERSVRAAATAVSGELFHRLLIVRDLALRMRDGVGPGRVIEQAGDASADFPGGLAAVSTDGRVVAGRLPGDLAGSAPLRDLVKAQGTEAFLRSLGGSGGATALAVVSGRPYPVVGAFSATDLLRAALPGIEAPSAEASAVILDASGNRLAHIGALLETDYGKHPGVRAALSGTAGSSFLTPQGGAEHVLAYSPIRPTGWVLLMEEPWRSVASPLLQLSLVAPLVLAPILVISLAALWFALRLVIVPLRDLQRQALKLAAGDFGQVGGNASGVREIKDLQRTMTQMARRIQSTQQALRRYIGKVTSVQEEERRRLARELHDQTIQDLIALDQKVQLVARSLRRGDVRTTDALQGIRQEARDAIQRVRQLSLALRPGYLEDLGLVPAIEALAGDVGSRHGISILLNASSQVPKLPSDVELALYRIVQESLANIARHAHARHASVSFRLARGELQLTVKDDGSGFEPPMEAGDLTQAGHFGLVGIRERAQSIGARVELRSAPGKGTQLTLRLPLSP